jgi:hypothetical protein
MKRLLILGILCLSMPFARAGVLEDIVPRPAGQRDPERVLRVLREHEFPVLEQAGFNYRKTINQ